MLSAQTANKIPPTGHFKYRHLFLTGLAPGKSKFKMLADLFPGESSPGFQTAVSSHGLSVVHGQGVGQEGGSLPLFIRPPHPCNLT